MDIHAMSTVLVFWHRDTASAGNSDHDGRMPTTRPFALDNLMTSLELAQRLSYRRANHVWTADPIDVPVVLAACLLFTI